LKARPKRNPTLTLTNVGLLVKLNIPVLRTCATIGTRAQAQAGHTHTLTRRQTGTMPMLTEKYPRPACERRHA
jgi:hypothetical protein